MNPNHFEQDSHYDDLEGNIRTFTIRDYSKKTSISLSSSIDYDTILKDSRNQIIEEILSLHPQTAVPEFENYIIRGSSVSKLEWDEVILRDEGIPLENLIMQKNVMSNRQKHYLKTY